MSTNEYTYWSALMSAETERVADNYLSSYRGDMLRMGNLAQVASEQGWTAQLKMHPGGRHFSVSFHKGDLIILGTWEPTAAQAVTAALLRLEPRLVQTPAPK